MLRSVTDLSRNSPAAAVDEHDHGDQEEFFAARKLAAGGYLSLPILVHFEPRAPSSINYQQCHYTALTSRLPERAAALTASRTREQHMAPAPARSEPATSEPKTTAAERYESLSGVVADLVARWMSLTWLIFSSHCQRAHSEGESCRVFVFAPP